MKRRRTYTRDFKISVIREVESGKTLAQVSRENAAPTATVAQTVAPTATPTPTPTPPGFELLFAVAGIGVAIVIYTNKKRRRR